MNSLVVNGLTIGDVPRVVGTISSLACLTAFPSQCKDLCDVAEVRLDEIGLVGGWVEACLEIEKAGTPVMLTLRSKREGGKCDRSDDERLKIFEQALEAVSIIDVEFNSGLAVRIKPAIEDHRKALLVSYHNFGKTPSTQEIQEIIAKAEAQASIVKISTMVNSEADVMALQKVLSNGADVPLCVIGMGAKGTKTRTSFPCLGSCLTYGYLDFASAPGQLSSRQLVEHLRAAHNSYNEGFIIGHQVLEYA